MYKTLLIVAAASGGLSVILGAFGAHKLREILSSDALRGFMTGVEYQFLHSIVLLVLAVLLLNAKNLDLPIRQLESAGWLYIIGTLLFSGSLYLLALTPIRVLGPINIGLVTPLGGLVLIGAWIMLLVAAIKLP